MTTQVLGKRAAMRLNSEEAISVASLNSILRTVNRTVDARDLPIVYTTPEQYRAIAQIVRNAEIPEGLRSPNTVGPIEVYAGGLGAIVGGISGFALTDANLAAETLVAFLGMHVGNQVGRRGMRALSRLRSRPDTSIEYQNVEFRVDPSR